MFIQKERSRWLGGFEQRAASQAACIYIPFWIASSFLPPPLYLPDWPSSRPDPRMRRLADRSPLPTTRSVIRKRSSEVSFHSTSGAHNIQRPFPVCIHVDNHDEAWSIHHLMPCARSAGRSLARRRGSGSDGLTQAEMRSMERARRDRERANLLTQANAGTPRDGQGAAGQAGQGSPLDGIRAVGGAGIFSGVDVFEQLGGSAAMQVDMFQRLGASSSGLAAMQAHSFLAMLWCSDQRTQASRTFHRGVDHNRGRCNQG